MTGDAEGFRWGPRRDVFVRRSLILAAATFITFMAITVLVTSSWPQVLLVPLALTLILAMDDFNRWRQVRDERWEIVEGHLIHEGPDGRATIAVAEIASVKRRLGSAVVLHLHSNHRVMMRYLPDPAKVVSRINAALPPQNA